MECVTQFVGKGHHIGEHAVEIGQNAALADFFHTGAECAAPLAAAGEEIDPCIVKCSADHLSQFIIKGRELLQQVCFGILGGKGGGGRAHGGEQIVPRQAVLVAQRLGLGFQILPELGAVLVHGAEHGVQSFLLHIGVLQSPLQRGAIAPKLALGDGLQLDGVQGVCHRLLDGIIAGKLCLVGILPNLRIGIIGKIADGRQIGHFAPIVYRYGAGQIPLQLAPCVAAGHTHLGHNGLGGAGKLVIRSLGFFCEEEFVLAQEFVAFHQFHQVGDLHDPLIKCSHGRSRTAVNGHDAAHIGAGFRVFGIGGGAQTGIAVEGGQFRQLFLHGNSPAQTLNGRMFGQLRGEGGKVCHKLLHSLHVSGVGRIIKALVDRV